MQTIRQYILDYAEYRSVNNRGFFCSEEIMIKLQQDDYKFKSKTPKATIIATLGILFREGKLNRMVRGREYIYSHIKRVYSDLDPYGEEDWDN